LMRTRTNVPAGSVIWDGTGVEDAKFGCACEFCGTDWFTA